MVGGVADRARRGSEGLHQHPPAPFAAAGAAGQLSDQRKGPLLGAEIGKPQRLVSVEHYSQRDLREFVALGHHLRTDEQTAARGAEAVEGSLAVRRTNRIGVEADDLETVVSQRISQVVLEPFGPGSMARDRGGGAPWTATRSRFAVAAVVAGDIPGAMQHERDLALWAHPHVP